MKMSSNFEEIFCSQSSCRMEDAELIQSRFLSKQNVFQDMLMSRGYLFLDEICEILELPSGIRIYICEGKKQKSWVYKSSNEFSDLEPRELESCDLKDLINFDVSGDII